MTHVLVPPLDQAISAWAGSFAWPVEGLLRLLLAAVAGGLVGMERELRGRHAGFRTNLLVCVGAAIVMLVSVSFAAQGWEPVGDYRIQIDPARIAYGVMAGIGFLGAGTIIHNKGTVRGLTTAAGLWCMAALGLASGLGLYSLTILGAILILLVLWVLNYVEDLLPRVHFRTFVVRVPWNAGCITEIKRYFEQADLTVIRVTFHRTPDLIAADVSLQVAFQHWTRYERFQQQLETHPSFDLLAVESD